MYFWLTVMILAVGFGVWIALEERPRRGLQSPESGWVYFLSPIGGAVEDPPAPIKIGMTHRNPYEERLPEIETMSPRPLELLHAFRTSDPAATERAIHDELAPFRLHGEWFDRDVTMAFLAERLSL